MTLSEQRTQASALLPLPKSASRFWRSWPAERASAAVRRPNIAACTPGIELAFDPVEAIRIHIPGGRNANV